MIEISCNFYPYVFFITWAVGTAVLSKFVYWTVVGESND